MARKVRMHFDNTREAGPLRWSLCGFAGVDTTTDVTQATCRICLARLRGEQPRRQGPHMLDGAALAADLHLELGLSNRPELAPTASSPPRLTPGMWTSSCRGGEHRRCGSCALCEWDREAERFAFAAPWRRLLQGREQEQEVSRFHSFSQALRAVVDLEAHGRNRESVLGPMLDRLRRGEGVAGRRAPQRTPHTIERAEEVLDVRMAIERAFSAPHVLTSAERVRVLFERTAGVLDATVSYEDIALRTGLYVGELRALVRTARRTIMEDLITRGLLHGAAMRGHDPAPQVSIWKAPDAA